MGVVGMIISRANAAEGPGRRRLRIALRVSMALATAVIVACFTASVAGAQYPKVAKFIPSPHFQAANRPFDIPIDSIMIHDTESSYQDTVNKFTSTDPMDISAVQYLVSGQVDASDPTVTQFVYDKDWTFQVANWWFNETSIGLEHVGFAVAPAGYFTQQLYERSADLVGWVAWTYHIPLDRAHILGHDNIPGSTTDKAHTQHWDPGPSWDWPYYMDLVRAAYKRWSHNAPFPRPEIPTEYTKPSLRIREISVGDSLASPRDWFLWTSGTQSNYANVYEQEGGRPAPDTLVRGASIPSTYVPSPTLGDPPISYNQLDFSCDNFPWAIVPNGSPVISEVSASDLRAKAAWGEEFALLGRKRVGGVLYDRIDFNGTPGWVRDSDTSDGWGALVRFRGGSHPTTLYSGPDTNPTYDGSVIDARICPDTLYGFSRAGQTYVSQLRRIENGEIWYQIDYNHRVAWVPADEVRVFAP
jgi:N-acetyl-anhydromuramyl-L-alanine amidase AmpD